MVMEVCVVMVIAVVLSAESARVYTITDSTRGALIARTVLTGVQRWCVSVAVTCWWLSCVCSSHTAAIAMATAAAVVQKSSPLRCLIPSQVPLLLIFVLLAAATELSSSGRGCMRHRRNATQTMMLVDLFT